MNPLPELRPAIVSASRATDIPAFHAAWFAKSLEQGYCLWTNPFNASQCKVCFDKARFFVFWTKNPAPFMHCLPMLDERGLGFYFQFTLNDYEKERLEPFVPPLERRLEAFIELSERLGPERVIWRFDPIALSGELRPAEIIDRIARIGERLKGRTRKLAVSFLDLAKYRNAKRNMPSYHEPSPEEIEELAIGLASISKGWSMDLATCAEAVNLELYGIQHNSCVDADLIRRLRPHDAELLESLDMLGKDKGQRKACLCVKSKDIGWYDSCEHGCLYCYACSRAPENF